jgi:hypothetical protein
MPIAPSPAQVEKELNAAGSEGWELVTSFISGAGISTLVFKRRKATG